MTTWQAIRKASAHQAGRPYFRLDNLLFSTSKLLKHVFSCSLLCKLCVFFLFKGSSKCGFPPCCPVQVLSFARCVVVPHLFLANK